MKKCKICGTQLIWVRGWRHPGGGLYVVRCDNCGLESDRLADTLGIHCPRCGGLLRDDHVAQPVEE